MLNDLYYWCLLGRIDGHLKKCFINPTIEVLTRLHFRREVDKMEKEIHETHKFIEASKYNGVCPPKLFFPYDICLN